MTVSPIDRTPSSDDRTPAIDLNIAQRPALSPEADIGIRRSKAEQDAAADARSLVADKRLVDALRPDELPTEQLIDEETERLNQEADLHARDHDLIGEVHEITAESEITIARRAVTNAAEKEQGAQAKVDAERRYLEGSRLEPDGSQWSDPVPSPGSERSGRGRRVFGTVCFWIVYLAGETTASFLAWRHALNLGLDAMGIVLTAGAVVLTTLVLSIAPHRCVPSLARAHRGGRIGLPVLALLIVPLAGVFVAATRAGYDAEQAGQTFGSPAWWGFLLGWAALLLALPLFVTIAAARKHNPHRKLYLAQMEELAAARDARIRAEDDLERSQCRERVAQAGRAAVADMYRDYPQVVAAAGEEAKATYRRELTRQVGAPDFTGSLLSR